MSHQPQLIPNKLIIHYSQLNFSKINKDKDFINNIESQNQNCLCSTKIFLGFHNSYEFYIA